MQLFASFIIEQIQNINFLIDLYDKILAEMKVTLYNVILFFFAK